MHLIGTAMTVGAPAGVTLLRRFSAARIPEPVRVASAMHGIYSGKGVDLHG